MPYTPPLAETLWSDGRMFNTTTGNIAIGVTAETPFFLLRNPSASTYTFLLKMIFLYNTASGVTGGSALTVRMYRNATVTSDGTAITGYNMNADSLNTPTILTFKNPTVSANGSLIHTFLGTTPDIVDMNLGWSLKPNENFIITTQYVKNIDEAASVVWGELLRS
jgi:hypothetical protein